MFGGNLWGAIGKYKTNSDALHPLLETATGAWHLISLWPDVSDLEWYSTPSLDP